MSDNDTTVTTEETIETEPKESRFQKAMEKIAPHSALLTTIVVGVVGGALITSALTKKMEDEDEVDVVDGEVIEVVTED